MSEIEKFFLLSGAGVQVLGSMVLVLTILTIVFYAIKSLKGPSKLVNELISRTNSWWIIILICTLVLFMNVWMAYIGTAALSYFAFREMSSQVNLRPSDLRILKWTLIGIPIQWTFAYINYFNGFLLWLPMISFIFVTFLVVTMQDTVQVTRSMGFIHWIQMTTIFSFSHLPYFLSYPWPAETHGANLLLFLLIMTEANDVFQFTWGKLFGKHKIIEKVSPNKTVEGFVGGFISSIVLGWLLRDLIQLGDYKIFVLSGLIAFVGFMGDVTFSAVKREFQIKDMSNLIPGHGGIMDRADSLAFTSIMFFHLYRFWST